MRAVIVQKFKIGNNCLIEPGVTIGADGFAYERDPETLEPERFHTYWPFSSNTDDIEDNNSDGEGSDADDSNNEDVIEEDIEDLFEEDDETESSDGEIGDLFE